jgi:hypothetical protein
MANIFCMIFGVHNYTPQKIDEKFSSQWIL